MRDNRLVTKMKYEMWCSYCGKTLSIEQETELSPEQYICDKCSRILDAYVVKDEK